MIHDLKILPEYFIEVVRGNKTFEVRKDDRPFNVGDELILYEVNCGRYTGRNIKVIITYILRNPDYCKEGYCILGFKQPVKRGRWIETHISLCKWIPENEKEEGHNFYMAELKCSCCERYNTNTFSLTLEKPDFCQHCGARMDLGDEKT